MNSPIASMRNISGEGWAAIAGALSAAFLFGKKLLGAKPAKAEALSRAEFYSEMLATREHINARHLSLLEKLDTNHRELLAALERQAARVSTLEAGLARVDERTR
jgi:hypothetical protein